MIHGTPFSDISGISVYLILNNKNKIQYCKIVFALEILNTGVNVDDQFDIQA